jgi:ribosomal protein L29
MATTLATKEIRTMQLEDLHKEIREKRTMIAKMQVEIDMRSEKDTAKFLRLKKEIARLLTILNEKKRNEPLKTATKKAKVSAPTTAK